MGIRPACFASICTLLLSFLMNSASGQTRLEALAHPRGATVGIAKIINNENKTRFVTDGSGVLVTKNGNRGCIVTAKHNFYNPKENYAPDHVYVYMPKKSASAGLDLGIKLQLTKDGKNTWKSLDDDSDLAIVDAPDLSKYFPVEAIRDNELGDISDIYQGANIIALGYPAVLDDYYAKSPVARGGLIAWVDPDGPESKPFLVDATLLPGNSGGPIYRVRFGIQKDGSISMKGGYALIGLHSRGPLQLAPIISAGKVVAMPDPNGGPSTPVSAAVHSVGGIGIIEPISKIRELISRHCS